MSDSELPRLLSFTLDGWPVLGGPVTITLNDGVAVLVGRNGAGKSAILEGFMAISSFALGNFNPSLNNNISKNNDDIPALWGIRLKK
ncbi:MAG: ATP-binding protein [Microcystaceae cyanobacterium]